MTPKPRSNNFAKKYSKEKTLEMLERDIEFYKICNNKKRVKFLELIKKDLMTQINSTFQIKVTIEKSEDGFFCAYSQEIGRAHV